MKLKKMMLVSIVLLAILTIGAVSANDDVHSALAVDESAGDTINAPADDVDLIADDSDDIDDGMDDGIDDVDDGYDDEEFEPIKCPQNVPYNSDENITLTLPEDAQGKLYVAFDCEENFDDDGQPILPTNGTKIIKVVNGKAAISLKNLDIADHLFYLKYVETEGSYQEVMNSYVAWKAFEVNIIPLVIPRYVWSESDAIIKFSVPAGVAGTVTAYNTAKDYYEDEWYSEVRGDLIANASISDGKINLGRFDEGDQKIWFVFNSTDGEELYDDVLSKSFEFEVISEDPNADMEFIFPSELTKAKEQAIIINNVSYCANPGKFVLIVDGNVVPSEFGGSSLYFDASNLTFGSHDCEVKFLGDGYFKAQNASGSFEISQAIIHIPDTYYLFGEENNDDFTIILPYDAEGNLTVKANGTVILKETFTPSDDDTEKLFYVYFDDLNTGIYDMEVIITGKYATNKTGKVNVTYVLSVAQDALIYGDEEILFAFPTDLSKEATVTIDGVDYKVIRQKIPQGDYAEIIEDFIRIPGSLAVGNHDVIIKYPGDERYCAAQFNTSIYVIPDILVPVGNIDKNKDKIVLRLPKDANGYLTAELYRYSLGRFNSLKNYTVKVEDGLATISLDDLDYGMYRIFVNYTGTDYEILKHYDEAEEFNILPEFKVPSVMIEGGDDAVSISLPASVKGYLEVSLEDAYEPAYLVNGKASVSLKDLPAGQQEINVAFYQEEGLDEFGEPDYIEFDKYFKINVLKPAIKANDLTTFYTVAPTYKVKITNFIIRDEVTFKLNNKAIGTGTIDNNGYASIKLNKNPGTYKITAVYKKVSVTKKLTVKHIVSMKAGAVKKSAKKLVITVTVKVGKKPLKGKKITFKFNGKKIKTAKTNKKGVVKVTIKSSMLKKLKVGKKVTYQATYLKDTVKKTVKVKK